MNRRKIHFKIKYLKMVFSSTFLLVLSSSVLSSSMVFLSFNAQNIAHILSQPS